MRWFHWPERRTVGMGVAIEKYAVGVAAKSDGRSGSTSGDIPDATRDVRDYRGLRHDGVRTGQRRDFTAAGVHPRRRYLSRRFMADSPIQHQLPDGARAQVQISPNPATVSGGQVTITGHCGGGTHLKAIISDLGRDEPVLENVCIVNDDPEGFEATATVSRKIGHGIGPIFVDCGGQLGVTLLVTHMSPSECAMQQ
jgi:hypothetical protein